MVGDFAGGQAFLESGNVIAGNTKIYAELLRLIPAQMPAELRR